MFWFVRAQEIMSLDKEIRKLEEAMNNTELREKDAAKKLTELKAKSQHHINL